MRPQIVTHPRTNRARRRVTSLIETNALPLSQAAKHWRELVACGLIILIQQLALEEGTTNASKQVLVKRLLNVTKGIQPLKSYAPWTNQSSTSSNPHSMGKMVITGIYVVQGKLACTIFHMFHNISATFQLAALLRSTGRKSRLFYKHKQQLWRECHLSPEVSWIPFLSPNQQCQSTDPNQGQSLTALSHLGSLPDS